MAKIKKYIVGVLLLCSPFVAFAVATELFSTSLFNDGNLVSYYRLSDVNDAKASNNLTNINTVTFSAGQFGNAATGPCTIAGATGTALSATVFTTETQNFSVNAWAKLVDNGTDASPIVFNGSPGTGGWDIRADNVSAGSWTFRWSEFVGMYDIKTGVTAGWHMFTFLKDGNTTRAYVDGANTGYTDTHTITTPGGTFSICNGFWAGAWQYNSSSLTQIDDVSYFSRVLTATEISNLYNGFPIAATPVKVPDLPITIFY